MKIVSSTQTSAIPNDDSFESLLARQNDRLQSTQHILEDRPVGELQTSWKLDNSKNKKPKLDPNTNTSQVNTARRSASKNVFRKMGK